MWIIKKKTLLLWQISNILRNEENNGPPSIHYKASEIFNILLNFFQDFLLQKAFTCYVFTERGKCINFLFYNLFYLIFKPSHSNFSFILLKPFFFLQTQIFFFEMKDKISSSMCTSLSDGIICWTLNVLVFLFFQILSLCNSYYFASLLWNVFYQIFFFFLAMIQSLWRPSSNFPGNVPPAMGSPFYQNSLLFPCC